MKKSFLKVVACLMVVLMVLMVVPAGVLADTELFSMRADAADESTVWDGTNRQPTQITTVDGVYYYEISSAEELSYISKAGNEWLGYNYILTNDIVLNDIPLTYDSYGMLTVDVSKLNNWKPIDDFKGIFDGAGHTVSGVYVNTTLSAGFFANCRGNVSNLNITNSYIKGGDDVGGICGSFNECGKVMTNCFFDGAVIGENNVGGLIGINHTTNISCSGNYGDVWGTGDYVCGIVGQFNAYGIQDCFNEGNITSTGNYVAGIAGSSDTYDISGCINKGNIKGYNYVAGICGYITNAGLIRCGNTGNIIGTKYVGGICGNSIHGYVESWESSVWSTYNTGVVSGSSYVGGITGYSNYATVGNSHNIGNVIGGESAGAVIGYSGSIWGKGSVSDCYYLKTDTVNSGLNGFGNASDSEGIVEAKNLDFFCIREDKTLNVNGHEYSNACDETCNICGTTRIVDGHKEVTVKGYPATCTENGLTDGMSCSECNLIIKQQKIIKATGHNIVIDKASNPTCTKSGKTEGSHCSVCGVVIEPQKTIPELGHDFAESVTKEPTCTEEGVKTFTCSRCDYSYTETIPSLGHDITESVTKEPTCTEAGVKTFTCSRCDYSYTETIPALDHDFTESVTKEPTCTEAGLKTFTCSRCCYSYTEKLAVIAHKDADSDKVCDVCRADIVEIVDSGECGGYWTLDSNGLLTISGTGWISDVEYYKSNYFKYKRSIKKVVINHGITGIGVLAFEDCSSLESVIIPNSVTSIGSGAFYGCSSLESVTIQGGVEKIESRAFYNCKNLKSVTIPSSVKRIAKNAFGFLYNERIDMDQKIHGFVIKGYSGTVAEEYAEAYGIDFVSLDGHTHEYAESITSEPTCTENGTKTFTCSCGESYTESIPALGHTDSDKNGICDTCGEKIGETNPPEPSETNCSCMCHKTGFIGFIYKIARFFWKLFKTHRVCDCGAVHY